MDKEFFLGVGTALGAILVFLLGGWWVGSWVVYFMLNVLPWPTL